MKLADRIPGRGPARTAGSAVFFTIWLALLAVAPGGAQETGEELRQLRQEVEELRAGLEVLRGRQAAAEPERIAELERRVEVLASELERLELGEAAAEADRPQYGFGPAASKIYRTGRGLSIGGYGEMLYENFDSRRDDGSRSARSDRLDFLRAIVYVGYKFNDRLLLNTELEFEHASTGQEGDASVEFAYLEYALKPQVHLRGGLLLVPMGFLNELHEPTVFLGARRPDVERVILPTTWRENGLGIAGEAGPFTYRTYLLNGLDAAGFSASGLRGGRQKGSEAKAEDLAWVGRLDYTATPGLLAGVSAYRGDSGQGLAVAGRRLGVETTILEAHLEWRWRGLELRLLGVEADLDDVAPLNEALGLSGAASVGEKLTGFYAQVAYDLFTLRPRGTQSLTPYARWEAYDTQDEVPAGFARSPATDVESLTLGLAYQPIDQVILKVDFQDVEDEAGTGTDRFNFALGYVF